MGKNGAPSDSDAARSLADRPAPPAADVRTFLIADVRGYTSYTQENGDEAAGELAARFAGLARKVVEAGGGELLELRGDEALSVFGSARQALRAAVELQARFRAHEDGVPMFPLGIGIGLDAGEAVPIEGGYRGGALNLAARLCSLAGPGEILASETVASLARRIDGARFVPRRAVRLKGLASPVRVVEVVSETPLPPLPPQPSRPRPRVFPRRVAVGAIALVVAGAGIAAFALTRSDRPDALPALAENAAGLLDLDTNRLVAEVPVGNGPGAIAAGAGSVWVGNTLDGTVSRIDPETHDVRTIDVGASPGGLAFGAGSLWVASSEGRAIAQVDPKAEKVVQSIPVGNGPRGVAVGFNAVWVANSLDGTVSRIDLARGKPTQVIAVGGSPGAVAVSRDAVWVASDTTNTVSRIGPASGEVIAAIRVGSGPSALAVGAGSVWVANRQDGTVSRIDPATNSVTAAVPVGAAPTGLAVADGAVWAATGGEATLSRIDAATGQVSDVVRVGASPSAVTILDGDLWTTALAPLGSHRGGTLRIASPPLDSVDPAAAFSVESWRAVGLVYDGLVAYRRVAGAAGATLVANLATQIPTPTGGGRTYTFQLRPGIRYSNGAPVRPDDLRSSLERFFRVNPFPPPFFQGVLGAPACLREPTTCDLSQGVETNGEARTVTFHLTAPDPDFLSKLALPFASLVPASGPLELTRGDPLPGTGPYRIASAEPDRPIRLVRNPHFRVWSADARPDGYPDEIVFLQGQIADVEAGEADWTEVPPERVRILATQRPGQLHSDPAPVTSYMFLNVRVAPFDDPRVRAALNYATDRGRLVELLGGPLAAQPTCQMTPPNVFGYQPYCPYTVNPGPAGTWTAPDLAKASRLIDRSGTKGMDVTVWGFTDQEPIARYFASLLEGLGYRTSTRILDPGEYFETVADSSSRVQIGSTVWLADLPSASNFVGQLFSCDSFVPNDSGNLNYSGFCEAGVDAAIEAAERALDPKDGSELWAAADRELTDAAASVPFVNLRTVELVSERVGNYQVHPTWGMLPDQLWVR